MLKALSNFMKIVSGIMLVAMMLVTCADVAGNFFGHPILGSEEIVSLMAALLIAFVLPAAHLEKAHIGVELVYLKLPRFAKAVDNAFLSALKALFFALVSFECFKYAGQLKGIGQVSAVLELPTYYILYALSLGCGVLTLLVAADFIRIIRGVSYE
ncbi:MAG: TRAP transporter small permease [Desulfobacteraceae bacterium]